MRMSRWLLLVFGAVVVVLNANEEEGANLLKDGCPKVFSHHLPWDVARAHHARVSHNATHMHRTRTSHMHFHASYLTARRAWPEL